MKNIFDKAVTGEVIDRINKLTPSTKAVWGSMSVAQMLAHCNVSYETVYENKHPAPNAFLKFFLKTMVKNSVTNETPYKRNGQTAPSFIIKDERNFEAEKTRLIAYVKKTCDLGAQHFDGKESISFGVMNKTEWNNLFYKHLDHHLSQFGV